jgi:hypothetical protein
MSGGRGSFVLGAAALALLASPASAQVSGRPLEVRIDVAAVAAQQGSAGFAIGLPGRLAVAVYLDERIAIEPSFLLRFDRGEAFAGGEFGLGVAVPYYFSGGVGKAGLFVAPVVEISKGFGDFVTAMTTDFGADIGVKREWRPNVGQRIALTLRDGDSYAEPEFGVVAGITVRWP